MNSIEEFEKLLKNYEIRSVSQKEEVQTLLEIAGFPDWENVYSNILAFFLDTDNEHGFDNLMLRSLMSAYYKAEDKNQDELVNFMQERTEEVEREVYTEKGKRIDIVIKTGSFIIGIENKIKSKLYNDLDEYRKKLIDDADGRKIIAIILSLKKIDKEIDKKGFVSIEYNDLLQELKRLNGDYINTSNPQYQYLLSDFINHANKFYRSDDMKLKKDEEEFLSLWKENKLKIDNIIKRAEGLENKLENKAEIYEQEMRSLLDESKMKEFYKIWNYKKRTIVFDLASGETIDGCGICFESKLKPVGIEYRLGKRRGIATKSFVGKFLSGDYKYEVEESGWVKLTQSHDPFTEEGWNESIAFSMSILKLIYDYDAKNRKNNN